MFNLLLNNWILTSLIEILRIRFLVGVFKKSVATFYSFYVLVEVLKFSFNHHVHINHIDFLAYVNLPYKSISCAVYYSPCLLVCLNIFGCVINIKSVKYNTYRSNLGVKLIFFFQRVFKLIFDWHLAALHHLNPIPDLEIF